MISKDEAVRSRTLPSEPGFPERGTDPAHESLAAALRSSFNILRVIIVFLVIAYFASGVFQVESGQQGLIVRLGQLHTSASGSPIFEQGLHAAWPDPFDEKIRLSGMVHSLSIETFVFRRQEKDKGLPLAEAGSPSSSLTPGVDGAMITGDRNLCHGVWQVDYRIRAADRFVGSVGENPAAFEPLLRRLTETAILRAVAHRPVEDVTRQAIEQVTAEVKSRLTAALEQLDTGVEIDKITAETIEPLSVRQAFLAATAAQNERQSEIRRAEQRETELLNQAAGAGYGALLQRINEYGEAQRLGLDEPRLAELRGAIDAELEQAQGHVAVTLREARSQANEVRETVGREYEDFGNQLEAYRKHPRATLMRLWVRMRAPILTSKQNELFYMTPQANVIEILTNRDPNRVIQADIERYRKRYEREPSR